MHILSRNRQSGDDAAAELRSLTGNIKCASFQVDLSDLSSVETYIVALKELQIPINALINNAGTIGTDAMLVNHVGHVALTLGNSS